MKMKLLSEIIEEIKEMPEEDANNSFNGEEFEYWLKSRKEHYKGGSYGEENVIARQV